MTGTAGTFGATAAVARILKLDFQKTLWAFGSAGTQAAGLWEYIREPTHSKQIHTGKACFNGLISAYTARDGLIGPTDILGGVKGMSVAMAGNFNPAALDDDLGTRFTVMETSFKWHASCRHTHPSVDGLLELMEKRNIKREDIAKIDCGVYQATLNILNPGIPVTVHHSKFSMGYVLGTAAKFGHAAITDFTDERLKDDDILDFIDKVNMYLDEEIEAAFPRDWMVRLKVTTKDGKTYENLVETPKGDPGFTLTRYHMKKHITNCDRDEIEFKAKALFEYGGWKDRAAQEKLIKRVWGLEKEKSINFWN
jgi:2-methylcitrate dehydratase PrpD